MPEIKIKNQREFFQNIQLADNGAVIISLESVSSSTDSAINQYNFFKNIILTEEGFLKVTSV